MRKNIAAIYYPRCTFLLDMRHFLSVVSGIQRREVHALKQNSNLDHIKLMMSRCHYPEAKS